MRKGSLVIILIVLLLVSFAAY
ncbi:type I toxin-antitoxin system Ibs family toxin [Escherichia coli]|nr:type I toxin-antitoxin system Ibs family toxin [Escherichia coli]